MGASKIKLEAHILPRLMLDKRIYNFWIPTTTPTGSHFLVSNFWFVRVLTLLWKLGNFDQLLFILGKQWTFMRSNVLNLRRHYKWGKVKKNWHLYTHTRTGTHEYVRVGADLPPPWYVKAITENRTWKNETAWTYLQWRFQLILSLILFISDPLIKSKTNKELPQKDFFHSGQNI